MRWLTVRLEAQTEDAIAMSRNELFHRPLDLHRHLLLTHALENISLALVESSIWSLSHEGRDARTNSIT